MNVLNVRNCFFMLKMNEKIFDKLALKDFLTGILNLCKQKHDTNLKLVNITNNCEFCILHIKL